MNKLLKILLVLLFLALLLFLIIFLVNRNSSAPALPSPAKDVLKNREENPMSIEKLKTREYPASDIVIEQTLESGNNYQRYIASYRSDGLKIYGLLTVPSSPRPEKGFPTILFLHGYINPRQYVTTQDYVATQDGLAGSGFVTFKIDMRGHGRSEGEATGAHFSQDYTIDTLNAFSALRAYDNTDPQKIGIWGHSNGGEIGLRTIVVSKDVKASVFWAGVVGTPEDMLETYRDKIPFLRRPDPFSAKYGSPSANPDFWDQADPYKYIQNISGPVQLHHGSADEQVPPELSRHLGSALKENGKTVELYEYTGETHNFTSDFSPAMQRTIDFYKKYL